MAVQYISDHLGKTTGVFIPIEDWNALKEKLRGMSPDHELELVPDWHKMVVQDRMAHYQANPDTGVEADQALDELDALL